LALEDSASVKIDAFLDPILSKIPSNQQLLIDGLASIDTKKLEKVYVRGHFSEIVVTIALNAYCEYLTYQEKALQELIDLFIGQYLANTKLSKINSEETLRDLLRAFLPFAIQIEFRMGQKRKASAGSTFEKVVRHLLNILDIKCEKAKGSIKKLNRMDIVIPDQSTALNYPDKAIFISCKRTLRERWKQAIPEQNKGWKMYLLTLDDDLSEDKANEFHEQDLIVYVKDDVKTKKHLSEKTWIRRLSDLPEAIIP
jgi:hypothetical protein